MREEIGRRLQPPAAAVFEVQTGGSQEAGRIRFPLARGGRGGLTPAMVTIRPLPLVLPRGEALCFRAHVTSRLLKAPFPTDPATSRLVQSQRPLRRPHKWEQLSQTPSVPGTHTLSLKCELLPMSIVR